MEIPRFSHLKLLPGLDLAKVACHRRALPTLNHPTSSDRPTCVKTLGNVAHNGEASAERFRPHTPLKSLKPRCADRTRILTFLKTPPSRDAADSAQNP